MGFSLSLSILSAIARTVIRVRHFRRVYMDDLLLFASVGTYIISIAVVWQTLPNIFQEMNIIEGIEPVTAEFLKAEVWSIRINYAAGSLLWVSVYSVKFAFLGLFRRLIWSVRTWRIWWWCVFAFVAASGTVVVVTDPWICLDLGPTILQTCTLQIVGAKQWIYFKFSTVLDIASDVGVISIPVIMLRKVRMPLRKKIVIGCLLCLSAILILLATFRLAFAALPNGVIDDPWMWLWQFIEPALAIIVLSISAFRSLFTESNQEPRPNPAGGRIITFPSSDHRWLRCARPSAWAPSRLPSPWRKLRFTARSPRGADSPRSPWSRRAPWRQRDSLPQWDTKDSGPTESTGCSEPALPPPPAPTRVRDADWRSHPRSWWRVSLPPLPSLTIHGLGLTRPGSRHSGEDNEGNAFPTQRGRSPRSEKTGAARATKRSAYEESVEPKRDLEKGLPAVTEREVEEQRRRDWRMLGRPERARARQEALQILPADDDFCRCERSAAAWDEKREHT